MTFFFIVSNLSLSLLSFQVQLHIYVDVKYEKSVNDIMYLWLQEEDIVWL